MTMQAQITALAQAIAGDIKTLIANQGSLASLTTTNKANLVAAINELKSAINSIDLTALINDAGTGLNNKTWSISKIQSEITSACTAAINALVNGAPTALDTLGELATQLATDESALNSLITAVGNRVRFDSAQTLTTPQQIQACQNIGIGDPTTDLAAAYATAKA